MKHSYTLTLKPYKPLDKAVRRSSKPRMLKRFSLKACLSIVNRVQDSEMSIGSVGSMFGVPNHENVGRGFRVQDLGFRVYMQF